MIHICLRATKRFVNTTILKMFTTKDLGGLGGFERKEHGDTFSFLQQSVKFQLVTSYTPQKTTENGALDVHEFPLLQIEKSSIVSLPSVPHTSCRTSGARLAKSLPSQNSGGKFGDGSGTDVTGTRSGSGFRRKTRSVNRISP